MFRASVGLLGLLLGLGLSQFAVAGEVDKEKANKQAAIVAGELGTIASYLQSHPEMVLDFTKVSGEYCLNTWKAGGAHMSHFAVDPTKSQEDVIEFVKAASFTEPGVEVASLPRMPSKLGAMEPGKWYYLPAEGFEPHHGKAMPIPLLIRASNIE